MRSSISNITSKFNNRPDLYLLQIFRRKQDLKPTDQRKYNE